MRFLPLILANLWRKPTRTLFMFASMVLGFTLLGLAFGLHASLRDMAAKARADRIYTSAEYGGRLRLPQLDQILRLRGVSDAGALDSIAGYFQRPGNKVLVLTAGPGIRNVFPELALTDRQWERLSGARDGAFVSHLIAKKFGLKPGSRLPIISQDTPNADGSSAWTFDVLGIIPDIPLMPVGFVVGNYEYLNQSRLQSRRGEVGQFWVIAKNAGLSEEVMKEIDSAFANSEAATHSVSEKEQLESMGGSGSGSAVGIMGMALVGASMIALLTSNAMGHSIRERSRELAVLKTLGFSNAGIALLVLTEAAIPCLFGCLAGVALAAAIAAAMPLISPAGFVLPVPEIGPTAIGLAVGTALAIAIMSAVLPVLRITRLHVATALAKH